MRKQPEVKFKVTLTEGYRERFTQAILDELRNRDMDKEIQEREVERERGIG